MSRLTRCAGGTRPLPTPACSPVQPRAAPCTPCSPLQPLTTPLQPLTAPYSPLQPLAAPYYPTAGMTAGAPRPAHCRVGASPPAPAPPPRQQQRRWRRRRRRRWCRQRWCAQPPSHTALRRRGTRRRTIGPNFQRRSAPPTPSRRRNQPRCAGAAGQKVLSPCPREPSMASPRQRAAVGVVAAARRLLRRGASRRLHRSRRRSR